jgi:subtilisin-like proprotein convertase family protein
MKQTLLVLVFALFFAPDGFSQGSIWKAVPKEKATILEKLERTSHPMVYDVYQLDLARLKSRLQQAPSRESMAQSNVTAQFPDLKGNLKTYRIYEASVMERDLAARYPEIQSYIGQSLEDPSETCRISTTLFGLHVMTFTAGGTTYIDPYSADRTHYMVYAKRNLTSSAERRCLVEDEAVEEFGPRILQGNRVADGIFRNYRLAMASTIEYSAFHVNAAGLNAGTLAQKKGAVLAAMAVTMTRVNGLYERDMSLKMTLVANNDQVIFIDSDNFDNNNAGTLINQSQTVIDATIGFSNYDIGHTVSTGGGGLAQLNSPCTGNKAKGITGSGSPVGDPFDIDYVAHEIGHQFGATHTFNNSCGGNRSGSTAVEPGSGVTIMGYAGICAPDIQPNSDDHFHAVSIAQMTNFVLGTGGTCASNTQNNNPAPVVNAGPDYTIPHSTAFILKGSATDANNTGLSYCWEQVDNQISTQPPVAASTGGPNVTSDSPVTSPNRYIPNFTSVLAGNLTPTWEVVPSVGRTMNFALTVRDNGFPNGGQTQRDDTRITFASTGPFAVTSPNTTNMTWNAGSTQNVTWSLGGSNAAPINTANVNILLSVDGGQTFTMLLANTPNDGTEAVTLPTTPSPYCRIMIEAVGNIYYAVSKSFALGYTIATSCNTYSNTSSFAVPDGLGANTSGPVATSTISVPATGSISDVNVGLNVSHTWVNDLVIGVVHPDGTQVLVWNRACGGEDNFNITLNDGSNAFACANNMTGTYAPSQPLSAFNNKPANGTWTLRASDWWNADTGTVNSWSLQICVETVTLATAQTGLTDFAVYPNPNNGNFNIQFESTSTSGVKVMVHDMRGRLVFDRSFANQATFSQNIQLNNVQSGLYLLTVADGDRKEVRKIVIE